MKQWEFSIDVGGTFTDCIAVNPNNEWLSCKFLSSGFIKGKINSFSENTFYDSAQNHYSESFFENYSINLFDKNNQLIQTSKITFFDSKNCQFKIKENIKNDVFSYEIFSDEPAPLICIRYLMKLKLDESIGKVELRLGTTKGTNALLERKGAKTALITTKGFGDVFEIGTQARPDLFALKITKPELLYRTVFEIDERIGKSGNILKPINENEVREYFKNCIEKGFNSVAICFLNSYINPEHELLAEKIAKEFNFKYISVSTKLNPTIKFLNRGDTAIVDSYLSPVIKDYIDTIKNKIPESDFKIMTSSGGLVSANNFTGRDSILSGPAGGVVGFSHAANISGFKKSIGFDMGGTSTDVSRFDGNYEYQFNSEKAGVRIVAPMYAIETVAAGGGSICKFDGQKLIVGPQSAGADPGPACYGKGGDLTITDINFFNGKIIAENFPFPIYLEPVIEKLKNIQKQIKESLSKELSIEEIADGFNTLANLKMASAIKNISTAKGYNPSEYALVSFGGAGSQHCCQIAEILGINDILIHPYSGILSAYGISMADIKRFSEKTVLKILSDDLLKDLESDFLNSEEKLEKEIINEGIKAENIEKKRLFDLRYKGEDSVITVSEDYKNNFEKMHKQLYGHNYLNREIEVVTIRSELTGRTEKQSIDFKNSKNIEVKSDKFVNIRFSSKQVKTGIINLPNLKSGNIINGPVVITDNFSTIIVDPDWSASIDGYNNLVLSKNNKEKVKQTYSTELNPVMLEIFNNLFTNIASQMGLTLQKTALSVNIKERFDFSCAILDSNGDLIINAPHIPVHLGAMSETVKYLIHDVKDIKDGDVYVCNDPNLGGSHLPDITVISPVFSDNKIVFFTASRAHHAEIGGLYPGSAYPFAKNLSEEGVVFRNLKIMENGIFLEEVLRKELLSVKYPSRAPDENIADIQAAIAANQTGINELIKEINHYSWEVVNAYMGYIKESSEEKTLALIKKFDKKDYSFIDYLDDSSPIALKITVNENKMTFDFTGSAPVNNNSLNANKAIVQSVILYCLRCMINENIPLNSGVLKPVEILLPEGMLNPPQHEKTEECAAVFAGNVEISQRLTDVVFGALEIVAASQGTMNNFVFGNDKFGYYETICGGTGGGNGFNGTDAVHSHMTNTRLTDVEILEKLYPVEVVRFQIRENSGGKGKYQGGNGIIREIKFLEKLQLSLLTQRRKLSPFGLKGGQNGEKGKNLLKKNGIITELESLCQSEVNNGDIIEIQTPGGGGFGRIN